jgi:Prealbumin-like fold domain
MGSLRHVSSAALFAVVVVLVIGGGVANAAAPKALINESTVSGSPSQEEAIAAAQGFAVTVVSDATWGAMTAADFGQYDLLIAGDPTCGFLPPGLISSASVYGPVVMGLAGGRTSAGNRIVVGTDPVYHDGGDFTSPGARGTIIREGIAFAGSQPGRTGMYFDATCSDGSQAADTLSILNALSAGGGAWTIDGTPPCGGSVSLIASNPSFADLTTASLQGWGCSVHESFPTFRTDWSALAVATDTASHPTCGVDPGTGLNACGEAYLLIAGSSIVVNSLVISVSPLDSTNPIGVSHTVTANVHEVGGTPVVAGQLVDFTVTGQNSGASGTCVPVDCKSDVNGNVSFTYFDGNGAGDDTIKASFTDAAGSLQTATAQKHWMAVVTTLHVIKHVVNDSGGSASAANFTMSVTGTSPNPASFAGAESPGTTVTLGAGSYNVTETGPSGYAASFSADCTGTIAAGQEKTCTVTNDDVAAPPVGNEGCSHGYWMNHQAAWSPTGYASSQTVGSVFSGSEPLASSTLLDALKFKGGSTVTEAKQILLRQAVAALLNAQHPGVSYPRTTAQVIAAVNAALASNNRTTILDLASALDADNNLDCPLS